MQGALQKVIGIDSNGLTDDEFQQLLQQAWRADLDVLVIAASTPGAREATALAQTREQGRVAELVSQRGDATHASVSWLTLRAPAIV